MKILIPVAAFHQYNTAMYVKFALQALGHDAQVITQAEFYEDHLDVQLFFGVDSAGPLDFPDKHLSRTAMWFIDSRNNCDPERRTPNDDLNARKLEEGAGWVFQAQKPDWLRNGAQGLTRCSWLPLAADPGVWRPYEVPVEDDICFGGNIWDGTRAEILSDLGDRWETRVVTGTPNELAEAYSRSRIGFNVSSFYGSELAYDINMRVFEVMSCGVPLVTNYIPELTELGIVAQHHVFTYRTRAEIIPNVEAVLAREDLVDVGRRARAWIAESHTYKHRMEEALTLLQEAGVVG